MRSHRVRIVAKFPQTSAHSPEVGSDCENALNLESFLLTSHNLIGFVSPRLRDVFSSHHSSQADATRPTTKNRRLRSPHVALIDDWQPVSGNATR
jgi:hypothetical protein